MIMLKSVSLFLLFIFRFGQPFDFNDCFYDDLTNHAAYVCGVAPGENFGRRTQEFLYCNNYSTGIDRADIQILSFPGCKAQEMLWNLLDMFSGLRILNVSFAELEDFHAFCLRTNRHLEKLFASHNHLTEIASELFDITLDLTEMDFSHNRIIKLDPFVFDNIRRLKKMNFSFNAIETLNRRLFSNLNDLEVLDFSNNKIKKIENDLLVHNSKLRIVYLNNNLVKRLECGLLAALSEASLNFSLNINSLEYFGATCNSGVNDIILDIEISSKEPKTNLRVFTHNLELIFNENEFNNIRQLNLSSSRNANISAIIQKASPLLETLDLSDNFIGELSSNSFKKFQNLKNLNLRRTDVMSFEFTTFYNQQNLQVLDISYNNLKNVDFHLFLRNFQLLESLNLEGNSLTEIDSVTRSHFPKLAVLGISKNNFSCDYLVKFLLQWHDLKLIDNSPNRTHVGGVDCVHSITRKQYDTNNITFAKIFPEILIDQPKFDSSHLNSEDLFAIKILLGLIFFGMCLFFITSKCKHPLKSLTQKLFHYSCERSVVYNQKSNIDIQHGLLLPQQMEQFSQ